MKWMAMMVLAALAAGCAAPSGRDDDSDAMRRSEARRELERECRIAAQTRTYNPDCPQSAPPPPGPERAPLPGVRLPGS
jgi:hypothetical protein